MTDLQAILDAGGPWSQARIIGDQLLIQGDCREVMAVLPKVCAVLTDPPYGIGENDRKVASRAKLAPARDYGAFSWDLKRPDISILPNVPRIIWGGNYFDIGAAPRWLIWDKQNGSSDFADGEMAWCSEAGALRIFQWQWNGFIRKGEMDKVKAPVFRVHPTQKPIALMEWGLGFLPDARTILDPFMGSGTTLVACQRLGRQGIGIELDADYFEIACKRVQEVVNNPPLFKPDIPKPTQEALEI